jgi:hypothetical protein
MSGDMLTGATSYAAEREWPVFPCSPTTGKPLTDTGFHAATTNLDTVTAWWTKYPHAAIGIATGVTVSVLDIDHNDFVEGVADLPDCDTAGGPFAQSGGGKWHLYFKPAGIGRRIRFSKWCDWLDGDGYVIAPPSRHKSGGQYRWWGDTEHLELTDAPAELLELLRPKPTPSASASTRRPVLDRPTFGKRGGWSAAGVIGRVATASEGTRNDVLHWAAWRIGMDVRDRKATRTEGDTACQQLEPVAHMIGLGEKETRLTITSGYTAGLAGKTNPNRTAA